VNGLVAGEGRAGPLGLSKEKLKPE